MTSQIPILGSFSVNTTEHKSSVFTVGAPNGASGASLKITVPLTFEQDVVFDGRVLLSATPVADEDVAQVKTITDEAASVQSAFSVGLGNKVLAVQAQINENANKISEALDELSDSVASQLTAPAKGATGPQGPVGADGPVGDAGLLGAKGARGGRGEAGDRGEFGPTGPRGETGAQGATGPDGPIGAQGVQGEAGGVGPSGAAGAPGEQGEKGATGPKGVLGAVGEKGPALHLEGEIIQYIVPQFRDTFDLGEAGAGRRFRNIYAKSIVLDANTLLFEGNVSLSSEDGVLKLPADTVVGDVPASAAGLRIAAFASVAPPSNNVAPEVPSVLSADGKFHWGDAVVAGDHLYIMVGVSSDEEELLEWRDLGVIAGAAGAVGAPGQKGDRGAAGDRGVAGATGPVGPEGVEGAEGEQGPEGPIGATGPAGVQGVTGGGGLEGVQGQQGATGPTGPQGSQGVQGIAGEKGVAGEVGGEGAKGLPGSQGPQGEQGPTGPKGRQGAVAPGPTGPQGPVGDEGDAGVQGLQGEKGLKGDKGVVGEKGLVGKDGFKGAMGLPGDIGEQGFPGDEGDQGEPGDAGDVGEPGVDGTLNGVADPVKFMAANRALYMYTKGFSSVLNTLDVSVFQAYDPAYSWIIADSLRGPVAGDGWMFDNANAGDKINYYFMDNMPSEFKASAATAQLVKATRYNSSNVLAMPFRAGNLRSFFVVVRLLKLPLATNMFSDVFLALYSAPTGTIDGVADKSSWYRSRKVLSVGSVSESYNAGDVFVLYTGVRPDTITYSGSDVPLGHYTFPDGAHFVPLSSGANTIIAGDAADFNPNTDVIYRMALGTNSAAARNSISIAVREGGYVFGDAAFSVKLVQ